MTLLLAIALGFGALASLLVRSGPPLARASAVLAMLMLAWVALVPPTPLAVTLPTRVAAACTADPALGGAGAALQAAAAADPSAVATAATAATLPAAVARAALQAGPRADELQVIWNGPLADAPAWRAPPIAGAAWTTTAPLPWSPEALALRAVATPMADRPLRLEASVVGGDAAVAARVALVLDGEAVRELPVDVPPRGAGAVDFGPVPGGAGEVRAAAELGAHRIERRGPLVVATPLPVLVLGAAAAGVVAPALRAQGVPVVEATDLPAELAGFAAVAVGAALPVPEQERLVAALEDGLGVFAFGPGLQRDGEPLRVALPLRVTSTAPPPGDGPGNGASGESTPPAPQQSPAEPPAPQPPSPPSPDPGGISGADAELAPDGPVEVDKHAVAMVLVVDRSGSMGERVLGGATKMSYAKTSAQRTAAALDEGDEVGLVTFGNEGLARVELPLTPATDRAAVQRGIEALAHAVEYTYLLSGLRRAQELLVASKAAVRHVVVLTDGEFHDHELPLRSVAHEMRLAGITLSIVSIVDERVDPGFLPVAERVAAEGGGAFLPVRDPTSVPQLVSAEVVHALDRVGRAPRGDAPPRDAPPAPPDDPSPEPPADAPRPDAPEPEESKPDDPGPEDRPDAELAVRAVARSPLLMPAEAPWPPLRAMADGSATLDAHVLLVAGARGSPLLAFANRGLGRLGVFAADLAGADAAAFRRAEAFPARLAQWIAAVQPPLPAPAGDLLETTSVTPPAPTPAEVAALAALAVGAPEPLARLRLPPPRVDYEHRPLVPEWALWSLALLLALAGIEWWAARR